MMLMAGLRPGTPNNPSFPQFQLQLALPSLQEAGFRIIDDDDDDDDDYDDNYNDYDGYDDVDIEQTIEGLRHQAGGGAGRVTGPAPWPGFHQHHHAC